MSLLFDCGGLGLCGYNPPCIPSELRFTKTTGARSAQQRSRSRDRGAVLGAALAGDEVAMDIWASERGSAASQGTNRQTSGSVFVLLGGSLVLGPC